MAEGRKTGGRQKGTPNKATVARSAARHKAIATAVALLGDDVIDNMLPADFLNLAWRSLAKKGMIAEAVPIAKEAAPYFNAKLAPKEDAGGSDDSGIIVNGGLPPPPPVKLNANPDHPSDAAFEPSGHLDNAGKV